MVSAGTWEINAIFRRNNRYSFHVPKYQRGYEWEEKHIEDFLDDLIDCDKAGIEPHFFGTVYTEQESSNPYSIKIVDGQQRITTCALFLISARDYFYAKKDEGDIAKKYFEDIQSMLFKWDSSQQKPDEKSFVLSLSRANNNFFLKNIVPIKDENFTNSEIPNNDSSEKLLDAFEQMNKFFLKKFKEDPESVPKINHIVYSLLDKFQMVQVNVPKEADAYHIFDTINNRGVQLAESDLIKNSLFSALDELFSQYSDKEDRLDDYDETWSQIRDIVTGESYSDYKLNNFLHHYLIAFKYRDIKIKEIFVKLIKLLDDVQPDALIDDIVVWSRVFNKLRVPINQFQGNRKLEYYLQKIRNINSIVLYPVLIAGYKNYWEKDQKPTFQKLAELSFKFFIRGKTIGHVGATALEDKMKTIADGINNKNWTLDDVKQELVKDQLTYPSDNVMKPLLEQLKISNSHVARYLLEEIERTIDDQKISGFDVTVEHIMPKSATKWLDYIKEKHGISGIDADETARNLHLGYKNWLGNQTLLSDRKNKGISNKSFDEKKEKYSEDGYKITQQLANLDEWTTGNIEDRQKEFTEKLLKILDVKNFSV